MPEVLVFGTLHETGWRHLEENGVACSTLTGVRPEDAYDHMPGMDGIVVRAEGNFDREFLEHSPDLKVVGRHGIGVDSIDIEAASELGIHVVNVPEGPTEAVAEQVAMALVALPRRVFQSDLEMRKGNWDFRNRTPGPELLNKTLGIIGFGRIGRRVAEICSLGFRMRVLYYDAFPPPSEVEQALRVERSTVETILRTSDFITVHIPLTEETHHFIGEEELARMQSHAYLFNFARGPVVDEAALARALRSGVIAGAAVDVFKNEPVEQDNPLLKLKNVLLSPHDSALSHEATIRMSLVTEDIVRVLKGERPRFPVNDPPHPRQPVA